MRSDIIDISEAQACGVCSFCVKHNRKPAIDWAHLDPCVSAVLVKLTEGVNYVDPCSIAHCAAVQQSGRKLGGYHYLRVRHNMLIQDARTQIRQYLSQWMTRGCDLLPCLDVESGQNMPPARVSECTDSVSQAVDEVKMGVSVTPLLYTSPGEWRMMGLTALTSLATCPLWLAEYDAHVQVPEPFKSAVAHQWTGSGTVAGVTGDVDCSELCGDLGAMLMPC